MESLIGVDCLDHENSYRIVMTFDKNPFFKNHELWKEFSEAEGQIQATCSPIDWYPGKSLVAEGDAEDKKRERPSFSFFYWFAPDDIDESVGSMLRDLLVNDPLATYLQTNVDPELDDDEDLGEDEGDEAGEDGEGAE